MLKLATAVLLFGLAGRLLAADAPPAQDGTPAPADSNDREARLTTVEGSVYVHLHDHASGEYIAAEQDAPIEEGDIVRTGTDGHAEVTLDGESVIDLSPNTDFLVQSLAKEQTEFHIGIGSIAAKIKTLLQGHSMSFHTVSAVAAVRGTELAVAQDGDDQPARVGVFDEGHVSVTTPEGASEVKLGPGEETNVARNAAPQQPRALRDFAASRERMQLIRRRQEFMRRNWRPFDPQRRLALRRELLGRRRMKGEQLRNVRADILRRRYQRQLQRRQQIRQRVQQFRQRRQQRLRQEQQQRQQDQRKAEQRRGLEQQRQAQRAKQMQERRRQQAEQHRQEMERRRQEQESLKRREQAQDQAKQQRFERIKAERERRREERFKQAQERRRRKKEELERQRQGR